MTCDVIVYFYKYNTWATEQILGILEQLTSEEYNAPGCSGHGSVRDTLAHVLSTQLGWFSWFDGSLSVGEAMQQKFGGDAIPTLAQARERWAGIAKRTDIFLATLTEEKLNGVRSWSTPNGATGKAILWRLMLHVANHGTHTRAQIVAAIRRAGHNPGNLELMNFVLSQPHSSP